VGDVMPLQLGQVTGVPLAESLSVFWV
jgi:hypothetical protein